MWRQAFMFVVIGFLFGGIGEGIEKLAIAAPPNLISQNLDARRLETAILAEINKARTNPTVYANRLAQGRGEALLTIPQVLTTNEPETVEETIQFLSELRPLSALKPSSGLARAAKDRVIKAPTSNQPQLSQSVNRYGLSDGALDETIIEGETAQALVTQLILDAASGDRSPIFNPDFQHVGISCQPPAQTCAIIYAEDYTEGEQTAAALLFEQGVLEQGDAIMPVDGSLYDLYPLEGVEGQTLTVAAESEDFDTVVAIMDANNTIIKQNDDLSDSNSNSALTVTLPSDGVYYVIVNAYDDQGLGEYTLTVRE